MAVGDRVCLYSAAVRVEKRISQDDYVVEQADILGLVEESYSYPYPSPPVLPCPRPGNERASRLHERVL